MDGQENVPAIAGFLSLWLSLPWVWRGEEDGKSTAFMLEEEIPWLTG